jgi:hypothetical protein
MFVVLSGFLFSSLIENEELITDVGIAISIALLSAIATNTVILAIKTISKFSGNTPQVSRSNQDNLERR